MGLGHGGRRTTVSLATVSLLAVVVALAATLAAGPALAQAHHPFSVGISEGGGPATGLAGWLLAEQAGFERQLATVVRATTTDPSAVWLLAGLSFLYGVFHAAGPGHGKAVVASYLFANERALRRGLVISLLAALLQGAVAVGLVGVLAMVLHTTAARMKDAANLAETLSYAGIAVLGGWLVWRKGRALVGALRHLPGAGLALRFPADPLAVAGAGLARAAMTGPAYRLDASCACVPTGRFAATAVMAERHDAACGHVHAPDPATLGEGFSWREAGMTVVAAGLRPCSGAILVLVYAATQGVFAAGVAAVAAMSLGTAITTGALATLAVLAKGVALRMARPGSRRGLVLVRALEVAAGALVLAIGLSLLLGSATIPGA